MRQASERAKVSRGRKAVRTARRTLKTAQRKRRNKADRNKSKAYPESKSIRSVRLVYKGLMVRKVVRGRSKERELRAEDSRRACSSEQEHREDALVPVADEGRSDLRKAMGS